MLHKEGLDNKNRALSFAEVFGGLSMSADLSSRAELIALAVKQSCHRQSIRALWRQPSPLHPSLPRHPESRSLSTAWSGDNCLPGGWPGRHPWVDGPTGLPEDAATPVLKVTGWLQKSKHLTL